MIHFNIINPSDPYTMQAPDLEIAAVAILLLGNGQYALEQIGGDRSAQVPIFMLGVAPDPWFKKQFDRGLDATFEHVVNTRRRELISALASVHIGTPADKVAFDEEAVKCVDDDALVKLLRERHDARRTSMNDIGRAAWEMASQLAATAPAGPQDEIH